MSTVGLTTADGVATVTVGDGTRRNALRTAGWQQLQATVEGVGGQGDLRAVVVRGHGDTFCAGSDMRDWVDADGTAVDASFDAMEAALRAVEALAVPTVAVVRGAATGAGCQLALACDVTLMATSARIGMPVAALGIQLSASFAGRLSVRIGPTRTKELLYSGRLLDAGEAVAVGLANRVVADDELDRVVAELLGVWVSQPPAAMRAAKAAVQASLSPLVVAARSAPAHPASDRVEFPRRVRAFLDRRRGPG